MKEAVRLGYREAGLKFFFRGIVPQLARAFPVEAVTLVLYDTSASYFSLL